MTRLCPGMEERRRKRREDKQEDDKQKEEKRGRGQNKIFNRRSSARLVAVNPNERRLYCKSAPYFFLGIIVIIWQTLLVFRRIRRSLFVVSFRGFRSGLQSR